jgi:hypothetical protein
MPTPSKPNLVRQLTVLRGPDDPYQFPHAFVAELVDLSGEQPPEPVPFEITKAFSAELARWLMEFQIENNCLKGRLGQRYNSLYCELLLAILLQRHLGWTDLACQIVCRSGENLPSQLLGLYPTDDSTTRRLMPAELLVCLGQLVPMQVPTAVRDRLEYDLDAVGASVCENPNGYLIAAGNPATWQDTDFTAFVIHRLLSHLGWINSEFVLVYADPAGESTEH